MSKTALIVGSATVAILILAVLSDTHRQAGEPAKLAQPPQATQLASRYGRLPLAFEPNRGQSGQRVHFLAHLNDGTLFLTGDEALLALGGGDAKPSFVRIKPVGGNRRPTIIAEKRLPGRVNYLLGNDPNRWHVGIPLYGRLVERSVYSGIDLAYYGHGGQLEYDFVVHPGADPNSIAVAFPGVRGLALDANGDLRLALRGRELRELRPVAYQQVGGVRRSVSARFRLEGRRVRFALGRYDRRRPLVVDPTLVYSTYFGGASDDAGNDIAVDPAGNAYVTGTTNSIDLPTANATQPASAGATDAFVTKLNATGSALVYSTYLGGGTAQGDFGSDTGEGVAIDTGGNAYVTGTANSSDFPTLNALQAVCAGPVGDCTDAFVAKLGPSGTLLYSTFLGGSADDYGADVAVDSAGNAYVTGDTHSITGFPVVNPLPGGVSGNGGSAFVSKLSANGSALVYSTYLGQPLVLPKGSVGGAGIAVDAAGSAYVTGSTNSTLFPTTPNAFQPTIAGVGNPPPSDAFVSKLAPGGSSLLYSTYLGGSGDERGTGIAVDSSGSAYVTGQTGGSPDFPVLNAVQPTCNLSLDGSYCTNDAFVTKFSPDGSALSYSTFLGAPGFTDFGNAIAVDKDGTAVVTGSTEISCCSPNFPAVNPLQEHGFDLDGFVSKLSPGGAAFVYSSFLGGCGPDEGRGIAVDSTGNAYVTGWTGSRNFPTANPLQPALAGGSDAFIAKIGPASGPPRTINCGPQQSIVVKKETIPARSPESFSFLVGSQDLPEGIGPPFLLRDGQSQALVPAVGDAGPFFVRETPVPGWDTSASCDDGSPVDRIDLGPDETVTCTFVNTRQATIVVRKRTLPSGSQRAFSFTPSYGGGFALTDGQSNTSAPLTPGFYSVSEAPVSGWHSGAGCDDGSRPDAIDLSAGETVTCTFTNTQRGTLMVRKETVPATSTVFDFSAGGGLTPASFTLASGATRTFADLAPRGGYALTEAAVPGWELRDARCSDGSPATNISIDPGEVVTCTFSNAAVLPGSGFFVIGDKNAAVGAYVTFWGAQWRKRNALSDGAAPAAFKGFAKGTGSPSCGMIWTTDPGNSPPPPAGPLPSYIAVIVASSIDKSGPLISGNSVHIVVVRTNPGYEANPGHAGTGTVVAVLC